MPKEEVPLAEYERRLRAKVAAGEVRCPKCGNTADFLVNELGHVFCAKDATKIPMLRLD